MFNRLSKSKGRVRSDGFTNSVVPADYTLVGPRLRFFTCLLASASLLIAGCHSGDKLPAKSSKIYTDVVSAFYTGLGALQVGDDVRAENELSRATQLAPGEPAIWANWGVLGLRQRNFDAAAPKLERAHSLAPDNGAILYLLGLLEAGRGRTAEAIGNFRKAADINPSNLIAKYRLAEEIARQGDPNSDAEFQTLIRQILQVQPDNLAALLELTRVAAKRGDAVALKQAVARIQTLSQGWPPEVQEQLTALEAASAGPDLRSAAVRTTFLRNVLMRVPTFRDSLAAIKPPPGDEARPFTHFLRLPTPEFTPAPADTAMTFKPELLDNPGKTRWNWIGAISLSGAGPPVVVEANGTTVHLSSGPNLPFPGGVSKTPPLPGGIVPIDFNYDFKTDLVFVGAGGLRFLRQDNPATFTDVTAQTRLPDSIVKGHYTEAWAVDIEADGDLDLVLASDTGLPTVLRNNGDNTFTQISLFAGISGVRGFVWADLNGDGNPEAVFIDRANHLHVFNNERSGRFTEVPMPANIGLVKAITAADASHNGILDLLAVRDDGSIIRLAETNDQQGLDIVEIARVPDAFNKLAGEVRLHAADLDNNGAIDLLLGKVGPATGSNAQGALIWLGDKNGNFIPAGNATGPAKVFDAADLNADGRLDLIGLSDDGQPMQAVNQGTKNYHWQIIRPRARQTTGDQRINSFGVGGEIEIRSGLLVQMQPITGPQIHFGLGLQESVDVARILWPNGSVRAEFALKSDQEVVTEQRLKGSCPFLFAYNGKSMEFVKDAVPWGSAIGLRIDNVGTASIAATEEWYKIAHDQLAPRDGYYDLRITGELWETYYYDYLALMVVDHPQGTEVFTDERFVVPAVKPQVIAMGPIHKIVRAVDDSGQDVTDIVRNLDNRYLDTFGRGQYQGVTRDHYVEVDLGADIPRDGPLYLVARGWLHPSDSSVNVAIGQGQHEQAQTLSLEIPDGRGGWVVARSNLGFPAGRKKTCLFDLANIFRPGTPHRVRLRTNLEVYWDSIEWAQGLPQTQLHIARLSPTVADLHYRGYSVIQQKDASSPEIPDYNQLAGTKQPWRDLEGYYTRYGDVRDLVARVDDRYVIMNAGDEMALRFPAPADPPTGWVRDYVIAGDGWIKDGDYNSTSSKTVLPLPHHSQRTYDSAPGRLEDEWVYRRYPEDWQTYQTRYITPEVFLKALRNETEK
jgi:cytochrome c-type biogenesis protein CcmH/NrfG